MLLRPEFTDVVPEHMEQGVLYISIPYRVAMHSCACGCGNEVVTPIAPNRWILTWNGDKVTLYPSIGSFSLPCRSHYWITENRIEWVKESKISRTWRFSRARRE